MSRFHEIREKNVEKLCDCIKKTNGTLRFCAQLTKLTPATVYAWKRDHPDIAERIALAYEDFNEGAEAICVSSVIKAAQNGDWRAGIAWLERTKPEKYGKTRLRQPAIADGENALRIEEKIIYPENREPDAEQIKKDE